MVNWHKGAWLHSRGTVVGRLYHACFVVLCDIACIVCHTGSMKLPSVCLSVCPAIWPLHAAVAGLLLCSGREISIDCCTAGAQQQMRPGSRCQLTVDGSTVESYSCYRATVIRSIDTFPGVMLN